MSPPGLLFDNPPSLSQRFKSQVDQTLSTIIRTNHDTQFAQSELTSFHAAIGSRMDGLDDATLCDTFRKTVQLTTYGVYVPFLSRFLKKPCREGEVDNLLAPGLPDYIVKSSSTSGGASKAIPKYNRLPDLSASAALPGPIPGRTMACIFSFIHNPLDIVDENDCLVKTMYVSAVTSVAWREVLGLHPDRDEERMATFIRDFAAPYAVGFIKKWRSFLIIHGLFALGSRSLEGMRMSFVSTFTELIHHIDAEFDVVVNCIANGTIPDLDGIAELRHHLEAVISPDPERAAELRDIGRPTSRPGWCSLVWPRLSVIACTASGTFASSLPLARSFLGSNVEIHARGYGSAEGWNGPPYNLLYLNYYKLNDVTVTEFLDFSKNESTSSIVSPWEVDVGKRYEIVMTTSDGLWRYRIGDIVEIAGFDPSDGSPVYKLIERRGVVIRFTHVMISETELRSAMASVTESTLGNVVDWTATVDKRQASPTIGFFVELAGEQHYDFSPVGQRILDALSRTNEQVRIAIAKGSLSKPTVRTVRRGTFSLFRQLKLDEGCNNVGQIKVPVVLPKPVYVEWFSDRVIKEL